MYYFIYFHPCYYNFLQVKGIRVLSSKISLFILKDVATFLFNLQKRTGQSTDQNSLLIPLISQFNKFIFNERVKISREFHFGM
jgi:hypothetical protein